MAIDAFENIGISDSEKDFVLVKADQVAGYTYEAGHSVATSFDFYDAYDSYIVFRLTEALADYTFTGNAAAKNIALGNGSAAQITLPTFNGYTLKPLIVTDNPSSSKPESYYQYPCSGAINPRRSYCVQVTTPTSEIEEDQVQIFPNPSRGQIYITGMNATKMQVQLLNWNGQVAIEKTLFSNQPIDITTLPKGIYLLRLVKEETGWNVVKKLLIQ